MIQRRRHTLAVVALACAAWMAISPVLRQIHFAFASHRHVYCPEHNRFEDAGPKQTRQRIPASRDTRLAASGGTPLDIASRPECPFSNLLVQITDESAPCHCVPIPLVDRRRPVVFVAANSAVETFLIAPKHSPPAQRS